MFKVLGRFQEKTIGCFALIGAVLATAWLPGAASAACGSDCNTPPTCIQMGYRQNISCPEGYITCPFDSSYKWCKEYTCTDGRYQDAPLSAQEGYSCSSVTYHGRTCYECTCAPQVGKCRFNASNKGNGGILSSPCCNGNYDTCVSLCNNSFTTKYPANSEVIGTCDACGTTYYNWSCKSGYLRNAAGTACDKVCNIGDIYYADGYCSSTAAYDSSRKPVGVVFYVSDNGVHGKVISLKNLTLISSDYGFSLNAPFSGGVTKLFYGLYLADVPGTPNYNDSATMVADLKAGKAALFDGKSNTISILASNPEPAYIHCLNGDYIRGTKNYTSNCTLNAIHVASLFRPEGTATGSGVVGEWYLPTMGEMMQLYGYDMSSVTSWTNVGGAKGDVKAKVNATLTFLANKGINAAVLTNDHYWTANEKDENGAWTISMANGYRTSLMKNGEAYVRSCHQF